VATDPLFVIGNGANAANPANALTVLKNGKVGIIEDTPTALLHLGPTTTTAAQIRLDATTADPATPNAGDLWFNGTNLYFNDGTTTLDLLTEFSFEYDTTTTPDKVYFTDGLTTQSADFIFGSDQLDDDGDTTHDFRMFFDKSKGAFRAGYVEEDEWDSANVGLQSFATGYDTTASGDYSTAMGDNTTAGGENSTAMGKNTKASADDSTAMGNNTKASGDYSTAMGYYTTASGIQSTAMGFVTTADGLASTAMGRYTTASGDYSTAMGDRTTAKPYASVVLGRYNVISGTTDTWVATEPLFVIGNGAGAATPANALTVLKNGTVSGTFGTYHQSSDRRLKNNITDVADALDKVMELRGVTFNWKEGDDKDTKYGLIAQEVEEVLPEIVHTNETGYKAIEWWQLNGVYVEAIKELNDKNTELRSKVETLESLLEQMEARLTVLED
jgi:hypothetical protein